MNIRTYKALKDFLKSIGIFLGGTLLIVVLILIEPAACVDDAGTRRVLTQQGYTNIHITGFRWFGRSRGDVYSTGFEATSPNGNFISGYVTSGWWKGYTIRFN